MQISQLDHFMRLALEQSRNCGLDVPVGAVIINGDQIIASGFNQRETLQDPLGHAELIAIRQASKQRKSWRLNGCTLICTLEPCPMCAEAIIQSRIETVIFGAFDPIAGACGSVFDLFARRKSLPTPELIAGILEAECSAMLQQFFKDQRKRQGKPGD